MQFIKYLKSRKKKMFAVKEKQEQVPGDIAIVGMACRFPGADSFDEFWDNIAVGKHHIREVPKSRWDWQDYWGDPQSEDNKTFSKWGSFINDVDQFDAPFSAIPGENFDC